MSKIIIVPVLILLLINFVSSLNATSALDFKTPFYRYVWEPNQGSYSQLEASDYVDVNDDGLVDIVVSYINVGPNDIVEITYLNTGYSWIPASQWTPANSLAVIKKMSEHGKWNPPQIMTIDEAAISLRVSSESILQLIESKQLYAKNVHGQWRIHKQSLDSYMMGEITP